MDANEAAAAKRLALISRANPNPKKIGLFKNNDAILLVGEGDFSFAVSLALALDGNSLWCSSYDTKREVLSKYSGDVQQNLVALQQLQANVLFGVDCTNLQNEKTLTNKKFDKIVFNFPHIGGSTESDIHANQELVKGFFSSGKQFLTPRGQLVLSLRDTPFYASWEVDELAASEGLKLRSNIKMSADDYPGYNPRRTHPAFRDAPGLENAYSRVYEVSTSATAHAVGNSRVAKKRARNPVDESRNLARKLPKSAEKKELESAYGKQRNKKRKADDPHAASTALSTEETKTLPKGVVLVKRDEYKCLLCNRSFNGVKKLNGHVNSPAHAKMAKANKASKR